LGLPLFSPEVFVLSSLRFGVASFFIAGLCFEPTTEGCDNALLVVGFGLLGIIAFVEYGDSIIGNFDYGCWYFRDGAYIAASGLHRLYLIKNLMPLQASLVRKRV
jgi:hypothetical protein